MSFKDVLRIRPYRDLWLGQAISQLGDSIYYIAFMFMTQQVTNNFAMVGFVGAMETAPYLLVGPYAGVLADRFDRRRIMMLSDLGAALSLGGFAVTVELLHGKPPAWSLLVIPFVLSTMRCFFMPAKTASIPRLVPAELLTQANALSSTTFNVIGLMGLAIAAGLMAQLFAWSPTHFFSALLAVNALSFAISAAFVARLPAIVPDRKDFVVPHPWNDFVSGLQYLKKRRDLRFFIFLLTAYRLSMAPFVLVYVAANKLWFGGKPQTLMWFEFVFFVGMILGGLIGAKMKVRRPTLVFTVELVAIGIYVLVMAIPSLLIFAVSNFLCGVFAAAGDIPMVTYQQVSVEDAFRGRVNSVKEMVTTGVAPIGMVLGGFMLAKLGLVGSFLAMGSAMGLTGLVGFVDKEYRNVLMPEEAIPATPEAAVDTLDAIPDDALTDTV